MTIHILEIWMFNEEQQWQRWPEPTDSVRTLYGELEDLMNTVHFIPILIHLS